MPNILSVKNIAKSFKSRKVVKDISLYVKCGEAVGLLGPNGAGKTTSFYIISGLMKSDQGSIFLDDSEITNLPMYKRARLGIGYLPQEASIFRGLNVEENIMAVLEIIQSCKKIRKNLLEETLEEFQISHLRYSPAISLSGGERRRVEIARALAAKPKFILLDEPLAGIDPIAIEDLRLLISHLKDKNIGVLITDHNVRETLQIVSRAYIIYDGYVLKEGKPEEIVNDEKVKKIYLGERFNLN